MDVAAKGTIMREKGYCNVFLKGDSDPYKTVLEEYDRLTSLMGSKIGPVEIQLLYDSTACIMAELIVAVVRNTPHSLNILDEQYRIHGEAEALD